MNNKLLIKAFEKAEKEINRSNVSPRAQHLSDFIFEDSREQYGERILREKFNEIKSDSKETIRLKKHAEESLSHYLGYIDYADFVKKNKKEEIVESNRIKLFTSKNRITLIVSFIIVVGIFIYNSATKQRWMIWQEDHYIEVKFDMDKYSVNQLKIYKEERIEFFKKVDPTCDTTFFNADGSVRIWYGKNNAKELEYFTALGLHPETGDTLKPITQYMIEKYVCSPN